MARFEVEIDDKGEFVGAVPAEIDAIIKRSETMAHGTGFRSGQGKATEEAKKQLEDAIKAERAKLEAQMPLEREKWQGVEEENKTLKAQVTDIMRESSRNLTKREEAHAEEILKRSDAIQKRDQRIKDLVAQTVRAFAAQNNAREEQLDEVEFFIVNRRIGFDDHMNPYVKDEAGEPATLHGKPITIEAFVKRYLDEHPVHRKAPNGQQPGGGGRRGASLTGAGTGAPASIESARERIAHGDRSVGAINDLFRASRAKTAGA